MIPDRFLFYLFFNLNYWLLSTHLSAAWTLLYPNFSDLYMAGDTRITNMHIATMAAWGHI
jgi:hypothetical protein